MLQLCKTLSRIEILDFPKLGELPHLKFLTLQNVGAEYLIMDDVVEINTQFPSLESMELRSLFNLRGLLKDQAMRKSSSFPKLERLKIESCCSSLILPPFPSLKRLKAVNCSSVTLASFSELESLTNLDVRIDDEQMKCFVMEMLEKLTHLWSLTISSAQVLPVLEQELQGLKSLTGLEISRSEKVRRIREGWFRHLTALKTLMIKDCQELVELSDEMKYLRNVYLSDLPKMVAMPKALHHLSSLEHLYIPSLPQLNSLPGWLYHLTSLRFLYIHECPELVRLPTCIRGMKNLRGLIVSGCSQLERLCERGKGEHRYKIAHIPHLQIG